MNKILVFGNLLVKEDSLALKLIRDLKKEFPSIEFKEFNTVEDLQNEGRHLSILDVAKGIKTVKLITDLDALKTNKIFSLHDFDLSFNLKLLKKIDLIDSVSIFAVPQRMNKKQALERLKKLIKVTLAKEN